MYIIIIFIDISRQVHIIHWSCDHYFTVKMAALWRQTFCVCEGWKHLTIKYDNNKSVQNYIDTNIWTRDQWYSNLVKLDGEKDDGTRVWNPAISGHQKCLSTGAGGNRHLSNDSNLLWAVELKSWTLTSQRQWFPITTYLIDWLNESNCYLSSSL